MSETIADPRSDLHRLNGGTVPQRRGSDHAQTPARPGETGILRPGNLCPDHGEPLLLLCATCKIAPELYAEAERIFDGVCARLDLDPNDGDVDSADAVDWLVAAIQAKPASPGAPPASRRARCSTI